MYFGHEMAMMFIAGLIVGIIVGGGWISIKWRDYMKDKGDWD